MPAVPPFMLTHLDNSSATDHLKPLVGLLLMAWLNVPLLTLSKPRNPFYIS